MASTREEVISLPWGNLLQTAKSHYNTLATEREGRKFFWGWGEGVRKTFSWLMWRLVDAHEPGGQRKSARVVSGTKAIKKVLLVQA